MEEVNVDSTTEEATTEKRVTFDDLGLSETVLAAIKAKGFEEPTPIQAATIPLLLKGEVDLVGQAQTGTGKTAAFGLPIIDKLEPGNGNVQALILCPTRELAVQVSDELMSLKGKKRFSVCAIYGGQSIDQQLRRLRKGVDIVVGTPGRVIDHIQRGSLKLDQLSNFILDEADEMLNMGFVDDIEEIFKTTNPEKRVLLFSATMPKQILVLAKNYMRDHEVIKVKAERLTTDLTEQIYFEVSNNDKFEALCRIIDIEEEFYGIVFCRTKVMVDIVARKLSDRGYDSEALHGDVSQYQRERILEKFKNKRSNILVATDVAARGIDVNNLTHVVNYSLPQNPESYVHRIGRTGRAGNEGMAITFVSREEYRQLLFVKKISKADIRKEKLPGIEQVIELKKERVRDDLSGLIAEGQYQALEGLAKEILEDNDPLEVVSALLKHSFGKDLDPASYKEIREISISKGGRDKNVRLFVARGSEGGMTVSKLVDFICDEAHVEPNAIFDVRVFEKFSFANTSAADAEVILHSFKKKARGRRPLVVEAKPRDNRGGGNRGGNRAGGRRYDNGPRRDGNRGGNRNYNR